MMRCNRCGHQIEQTTADGFKLCEPCNQASIDQQQRAWQDWQNSAYLVTDPKTGRVYDRRRYERAPRLEPIESEDIDLPLYR